MDYPTALEKLHAIRQEHLLIHWNELDISQQNHLLEQIQNLDLKNYHIQQELVKNRHVVLPIDFEPYTDYEFAKGDNGDSQEGLELIKKGRVGCLVVAGGTGSRLRFDGPKGMFPISVIKKKSLFELLADKVIAAGVLAGNKLSLAIMTSPLNHQATIKFFQEKDYFGLESAQVTFFEQKTFPSLDQKGNLFLENRSSISEGPDGNGSALQQFVHAGIWANWQQKGVKFVNFILIDNALADPFDAELIGYHTRKSAQISIKCAERSDINEKVGLVVHAEGKARIVEYSEMPEEQRTNSAHQCANLGMFCFSMEFIKETEAYRFPLHLAHKAVKYLDQSGITQSPSKPNAFKFEKFIFDLLPQAERVEVLLYQREKSFAPLKNLTGNDNPESVQVILQNRDRQVLAALTGMEIPNRPFELAQQFHYPSPSLIKKWLGKKLPNVDYIEP